MNAIMREQTPTGATSNSAQQRAAQLLATHGGVLDLRPEDALKVIHYMEPRRAPAGTVLIREGDAQDQVGMMLVLSGDVTVENTIAAGDEGMVVTVLGPGGLIGEMALIDGSKRSATCVASTDVIVAVLTRDALMGLMQAQPLIASRLLLAIGKRLADHLRETTRKLTTFAQLSKALQQELEGAHGVNRRLLDQMSARSPGGTPAQGKAPAAAPDA